MSSAHIIIENDIKESFRVAAMRGLFDVPLETKNRHEWMIDIPIEDMEWNIGLIVGASGSGKTVCAKKLFQEEAYHSGFKWSKNSILDDFPKNMTIQNITNLMNHVGFSSPPLWTKPFHVLSNGQKFRVELARILAIDKELTIIDEFTSVVDRNVARIGSYAISKSIKKMGRQIICLSCHRDIIEWLEPDWIYDMDIKQFSRRLLRRPKIKLSLFRVDSKTWKLFKEHHYLTRSLCKVARCYVVFWGDMPVAFTSVINMVGFKKRVREHRTVVLPDYQGVGIGSAVSEMLGEIMLNDGYRFFSTTSHPSFVQGRLKNKKWRLARKPSRVRRDKLNYNRADATNRLTCGFEFIGESYKST
ncbi:MAG: ABC transporter ATP-binding protein [Nitrospinae bacterium]|nr:ABC transporter ATP-binding protein [Nitrospinota bacterium]